MNDKLTMNIIGSIAFVISAIFTCVLFTGNAHNKLSFALNLGMALTLECSKVIFFILGISENKLPKPIKFSMVCISIFLVLASMIASISYTLNSDTANNSDSVVNSDIYKRKVELIASLKADRDNLPSNYISKKLEVNSKISALEKELYNTEIIADVEGFDVFLSLVARLTGVKLDILKLILFSSLSVVFEGCAMLLCYASRYEEETIKKPTVAEIAPVQIEPKQIDIPVEIIEKKEVKPTEKSDKPKFDFKDTPFTKEEYKNYVKMMYKTAENGKSKGYKKLSSLVNALGKMQISQVKACKIRNFLELNGVVKLEGNSTVIMKDRKEVIV